VQLLLHIALRSSVAKPRVLANADDAQGGGNGTSSTDGSHDDCDLVECGWLGDGAYRAGPAQRGNSVSAGDLRGRAESTPTPSLRPSAMRKKR
jgi:hypothetical protein